MTIFAVLCAGMFPVLHMGRPWLAYWLFPYPNTMWYWPQFRSPLVWDVFAVSTYLTVSLLFWFVGLIPDLATLRDRSRTRAKQIIYGFLAMGWRGSAVHWKRYETASLLLAGLATPLVVSVHTVVSFDFAIAILPGWHTTIFPPYFVAGAIYSGFAMVLCLAIPLRKFYGLEDFITMRHLDNMGKIMLATGLIVAYGYMMEAFMAFYSADIYEKYATLNRMARTLCGGVLEPDRLQHRHSAGTMVQARALQRPCAFCRGADHQLRHVAGALRHHRDQLEPRFRALDLAHVRAHPLGLDDPCGIAGPFPDAALSLHPLYAHDLHL